MTPEFQPWPKIPRLKNEIQIITEKIDGTNGCIIVTEDGELFAQSRTRILDESSDGDNFGFCKWVQGNKDELLKLGVGYHYGEWWGQGIQRGYGLTEKRFSLFNIWRDNLPEVVSQVPILDSDLDTATMILLTEGSRAAPGFIKPEGLVVYLTLVKARFKVLLD